MMGQPIIQFEHISKAFAGQPVLRDLSLSIESGEFVTVIGRSGCGKTTLLRLINRLITPDQGCVMVQGQDVAQTDPIALRRRIGYAIQSVGLFPHMTVEKNIAYCAVYFRYGPMEGEESSEAGGRTAGTGRTGIQYLQVVIQERCPVDSVSVSELPEHWQRDRRSF